jgi:hypothetical protein
LLAPGAEDHVLGRGRRTPKFLVAVAPGESAVATHTAVTMLAQSVGAHLTLVTVVPPGRPSSLTAGRDAIPNCEPTVQLAQVALDRLADRLRTKGISVAAMVVTDPDAAAALLAKLHHGYDLLAIGRPETSGVSDTARTFQSVIAGSQKPVFVVHAPRAAARSARAVARE